MKILSINIWFFQFCFEGMEEYGSEGLDELIEERKGTFFKVGKYFRKYKSFKRMTLAGVSMLFIETFEVALQVNRCKFQLKFSQSIKAC